MSGEDLFKICKFKCVNFVFLGCTEPLIVKFADGGNKKKSPQALTIPTKIWTDAARDVSQRKITLANFMSC